MYKITTQSGDTFLTERATYIKVHPCGQAYVLTDAAHAEGVMYRGIPYLYKDGCSVSEVDSFDVLVDQDAKNREAVEQAITDQTLDLIQAQQDITDIQLELLGG